MTGILFFICCADESISNDKMRLTLNLRDDVLHPTGPPLLLVIFYCATGKCWQAEVIVFRVNMMWLASNVCGNKWAVLPWEINSVGVNTDDWDGHCEVRGSQAGNVCVHGVCCLWIHTTGSLTWGGCSFPTTLFLKDNWRMSLILEFLLKTLLKASITFDVSWFWGIIKMTYMYRYTCKGKLWGVKFCHK